MLALNLLLIIHGLVIIIIIHVLLIVGLELVWKNGSLSQDTSYSYFGICGFILAYIRRSSITINTAPLTMLLALTDTTSILYWF